MRPGRENEKNLSPVEPPDQTGRSVVERVDPPARTSPTPPERSRLAADNIAESSENSVKVSGGVEIDFPAAMNRLRCLRTFLCAGRVIGPVASWSGVVKSTLLNQLIVLGLIFQLPSRWLRRIYRGVTKRRYAKGRT